jgi:hypothetical protein
MEGLHDVFGKERKVIWVGHDRGARVGHRLVVDNKPEHNIISALFFDIVPTTEQWRSFANPAAGECIQSPRPLRVSNRANVAVANRQP